MMSGAYSFGNGNEGFDNVSNSAMNISGGSGGVASCNAGYGFYSAENSGLNVSGGYTWKNGSWGLMCQPMASAYVALDFGAGSANANGGGTIYAGMNSVCIISGSANWSPSNPPFWTEGNLNSYVIG
jgi:hypothetical protein